MNETGLEARLNVEHDVVNKLLLILKSIFMIIKIEMYLVDHLIKLGRELSILILKGGRELVVGKVER